MFASNSPTAEMHSMKHPVPNQFVSDIGHQGWTRLTLETDGSISANCPIFRVVDRTRPRKSLCLSELLLRQKNTQQLMKVRFWLTNIRRLENNKAPLRIPNKHFVYPRRSLCPFLVLIWPFSFSYLLYLFLYFSSYTSIDRRLRSHYDSVFLHYPINRTYNNPHMLLIKLTWELWATRVCARVWWQRIIAYIPSSITICSVLRGDKQKQWKPRQSWQLWSLKSSIPTNSKC